MAASDQGAFNTLMPVALALQNDFNISFVADGVAKEALASQDELPLEARLSSLPSVTADAREERKHAIWIEDIPGTWPELIKGRFDTTKISQAILPEVICVINNWSKNKWEERVEQRLPNIAVTGQPAYDRFSHEDHAGIKQLVREGRGFQCFYNRSSRVP